MVLPDWAARQALRSEQDGDGNGVLRGGLWEGASPHLAAALSLTLFRKAGESLHSLVHLSAVLTPIIPSQPQTHHTEWAE